MLPLLLLVMNRVQPMLTINCVAGSESSDRRTRYTRRSQRSRARSRRSWDDDWWSLPHEATRPDLHDKKPWFCVLFLPLLSIEPDIHMGERLYGAVYIEWCITTCSLCWLPLNLLAFNMYDDSYALMRWWFSVSLVMSSRSPSYHVVFLVYVPRRLNERLRKWCM